MIFFLKHRDLFFRFGNATGRGAMDRCILVHTSSPGARLGQAHLTKAHETLARCDRRSALSIGIVWN